MASLPPLLRPRRPRALLCAAPLSLSGAALAPRAAPPLRCLTPPRRPRSACDQPPPAASPRRAPPLPRALPSSAHVGRASSPAPVGRARLAPCSTLLRAREPALSPVLLPAARLQCTAPRELRLPAPPPPRRPSPPSLAPGRARPSSARDQPEPDAAHPYSLARSSSLLLGPSPSPSPAGPWPSSFSFLFSFSGKLFPLRVGAACQLLCATVWCYCAAAPRVLCRCPSPCERVKTEEPRSQSHERLRPRRLNDYFAYDGFIVYDYLVYVGYFLYIATPQRVQVYDSYDDDYACVLLPGFLLHSRQLSTPGGRGFAQIW
ncbi:vegetative cell wall protein gp1 isoform X2 [Brachypodium distachyon]|uniref:vegetative cell wall protein gp1 isoform X2 n=1 Tax=Brachypodium distachyon TaxID=15368 RepID=UPI0006E47F4C|nr:vegetative cell wall protein gp1 isoform X2 [Brachypodium distachyon]|eukprot:XP_014757078.1 vegetative cell wall protein gp1 isoform X2 [Brachypodium distachyon]